MKTLGLSVNTTTAVSAEALKAMSLSQIAQIVRSDWKNPYFAAKPYIDAMSCLESIDQDYGWDSGKGIVLYFCANATTWRGETARITKAELKARCK